MKGRVLGIIVCAAGVKFLVFAAQNFMVPDVSLHQISRGGFQTLVGLLLLIGGAFELIRDPRPGGACPPSGSS